MTVTENGVLEGIHLRAILMTSPVLPEIQEGANLWGYDIRIQDPLPGCTTRYGLVRVEAEVNVPPYLRGFITTKRNGASVFDLYALSFRSRSLQYLLLASPIPEVLFRLLETQNVKFVRYDLRRICNDQFNGGSDSDIIATRLNAKLSGDPQNTISSVTLYGNDLVTSPVLRAVMALDELKWKADGIQPFHSDAMLKGITKRSVDPHSIRLKWAHGTRDKFGVNLDRFGNISFYLKEVRSFDYLQSVLNYAGKVHALEVTSSNPLNRSDEALKRVGG